jgi:phage/plasmid-like protein (TIGR03299 family)
LGITVSDWDRFIRQMKQLSNRKVSSSEADNFFQTVLNCSPKGADFSDSDLKDADGNPNSKAALSNERAYKRVQTLYAGAAMGAQLEAAQGSAWGLLNAVTEFVDHHRRSRNQDNRLDSAWFGQGALIKQAALDEALALL